MSFTERISQAISHLKPQHKPSIWDSSSYAAHIATGREISDVLDHFKVELNTLFDEYAAMMAKVRYEYTTHGIRGASPLSLIQVGQKMVESAVVRSLEPTRAILESASLGYLQHWMTDSAVPTGATLIAISPTGTPDEGYPGKKPEHYSFINVFRKTQGGIATLTQYRSYDNDIQLATLSANIQSKLHFEKTQLWPNNKHTSRIDHCLIGSILQTHHAVSDEDIEQWLYLREYTWAIKLNSLPKVNLDLYQAQQQLFTTFLSQTFADIDHGNQAEIAQFDRLVLTCRELFLMWVEDHAENYKASNETEQERTAFKQQFGISMEGNYQLGHATLEKIRHLTLKKEGEVSSKEEKASIALLGSAVQLSGPMKQLASAAHCILGTPTSLGLQMQLNPSILANSLSHAELTSLIGAERAKLWKHGTCVSCGSAALVGECSVCYRCELASSGQLSLSALAEHKELGVQSNDSREFVAVHHLLVKELLPATLSVEALVFDNQDIIQTPRGASRRLLEIINLLKHSTNAIMVLRSVIEALLEEHKDSKTIETILFDGRVDTLIPPVTNNMLSRNAAVTIPEKPGGDYTFVFAQETRAQSTHV
ncbi:MAG: hypothetical protein H6774_02830 [Pseudomonadales bacterium]|nr:hypothetical protein [Candidatus Woesebacteria bacterium]MCB9802000.1 hypothetical protein [Pseudomonadales bacterium]